LLIATPTFASWKKRSDRGAFFMSAAVMTAGSLHSYQKSNFRPKAEWLDTSRLPGNHGMMLASLAGSDDPSPERWNSMKKVLSALAIALLAGAGTLAVTGQASAQHYHHHHHHRGPGIGPVIGGLAAGAIIGGAIAASRPAYAYPPGYYAPGYAPAPAEYYDEPVCQIQRQQYWDGYTWRFRNIRVCD
jgi:hypothetical protein